MVYLFSNQKSQFGQILEGLAMEDAGIFLAMWSIFRPFGVFDDTLEYFVVIWYVFSVLVYCATKNLATLFRMFSKKVPFKLEKTETISPELLVSEMKLKKNFSRLKVENVQFSTSDPRANPTTVSHNANTSPIF
jgi:hypothetical protein